MVTKISHAMSHGQPQISGNAPDTHDTALLSVVEEIQSTGGGDGILPAFIKYSKDVLTKRRNLRISLKSLLLLVTVTGVVFGLVGRRIQHAHELQKIVWEQSNATQGVVAKLDKAWFRKHDPRTLFERNSCRGHSTGTNWRWRCKYTILLSSIQADVLAIDVVIEGGQEDLKMRTINITDYEAPLNRHLIDELVAKYKAKNWDVEIVKGIRSSDNR